MVPHAPTDQQTSPSHCGAIKRTSNECARNSRCAGARDWVRGRHALRVARRRVSRTKRFILWPRLVAVLGPSGVSPDRNPQFKPDRQLSRRTPGSAGYTDETFHPGKSALNLFFEWLGKLGVSLKEVSPQLLCSGIFVQKQGTWVEEDNIKDMGNSLRAFFRYATRRGWCAPDWPRQYIATHLFAGRASGRSKLGPDPAPPDCTI